MSIDMRNCGGENRKYFFLAVNTGFVNEGLPSERCNTFYRERSGPELYCAIVGNVVVPGGVPSNDVCSFISSSPKWRELASAITERGTIAGIQLSSTWTGYKGLKKFISRGDGVNGYLDAARSISKRQITEALDGLNRGTEYAVEAGYQHIQLHAAHGYLFNLLLDYRFSPQLDYIARHIEQWSNGLRGIGIETSIRVSFGTGDKEFDSIDKGRLMGSMVSHPVDYVDLSHGFYNVNKRLIYPSTPVILTERAQINLQMAATYPDKNFILSGRSALAWEDTLPKNVHVGICRDLIANPEFISTRKDGCTNCMECHYFSMGRSSISCGRWQR